MISVWFIIQIKNLSIKILLKYFPAFCFIYYYIVNKFLVLLDPRIIAITTTVVDFGWKIDSARGKARKRSSLSCLDCATILYRSNSDHSLCLCINNIYILIICKFYPHRYQVLLGCEATPSDTQPLTSKHYSGKKNLWLYRPYLLYLL